MFDRFGRTVIRHWRPSYVAPYYDHFVYTYDRASNRVTAENERTSGRDWLYTYDGLHRLSDARMGTLSGGDIATPDFRHNWSLDMLGNWSQFNEDRDGGGWELQQTRTHNDVNELTAFTAGAWKTPQHDPRGNMVTMPRPGDEDASTGKSIGAVHDIWNRQVRTFDDSDSDGIYMEHGCERGASAFCHALIYCSRKRHTRGGDRDGEACCLAVFSRVKSRHVKTGYEKFPHSVLWRVELGLDATGSANTDSVGLGSYLPACAVEVNGGGRAARGRGCGRTNRGERRQAWGGESLQRRRLPWFYMVGRSVKPVDRDTVAGNG